MNGWMVLYGHGVYESSLSEHNVQKGQRIPLVIFNLNFLILFFVVSLERNIKCSLLRHCKSALFFLSNIKELFHNMMGE